MASDLIYAVGDIHGRDDLLKSMISAIRFDAELRAREVQPTLIFLGDYIDRGPQSREVIDRLMRGVDGFQLVCLRGNHEALILSCTQEETESCRMNFWLDNGGAQTCASFNPALAMENLTAKGLRDLIGEDRLNWLNALPFYHETPTHLFVHAGIKPGIPMSGQVEKDLLWIRAQFLSSDEDHGRCVVHGHTPVDAPDVRPNRINVDTGAAYGGPLSCVVIHGKKPPEFLRVRS